MKTKTNKGNFYPFLVSTKGNVLMVSLLVKGGKK